MKPGKLATALLLFLSLLVAGSAWARDGGGRGGHSGGKHFSGGSKSHGGHFAGRRFGDGGKFRSDRFRGRHFDHGRKFHDGRFRFHPGFGVVIAPFRSFYYDPYYPGYYYPPPTLPPGYWYYCYDPPGYYPYVQQCWSGWQQVFPR